MVNAKKIAALLVVMILMFAISTPRSFANGGGASGNIDAVLIQTEDGTIVSVAIDKYVKMFISEDGALYEFLLSENQQMHVYGIVSGDKYIQIGDYIKVYISDPDTALEEAEAIPANVVATFMEVVYVNEETGEVILAPIGGEEAPVDKSSLGELISEAELLEEIDYTKETWSVFEEALTQAKIIYNNKESTQKQVNDALATLGKTISELIKVENNEAAILARFIPTAVKDFGYVEIQVRNIPKAMKYTITSKLSDGRDTTTKIEVISKKSASLIFYNEKITVTLYDANDNLIEEYENILLIK